MSHIDDLKQTQRIARETVEYLRELRDKKISTGKIAKGVVEALRKEGVITQLQAHEQKITEHDGMLSEIGESILAGFGRVSAAVKKVTLKNKV